MSINASIFGTIGKDAELTRVGQSSTPVAKWSVAVNRKQGGESTTWVNCSFFGSRAEKIHGMIRKGERIVVHGDLYTREYNGKTSVNCDVSNVDLCGNKRDSSQATAPSATNGSYDDSTYGDKSTDDTNFPF